jgi:thiol-disulfide isomerase/thioredoxin
MRRSVPLCMLVLVCGCAADAPRVVLRSDDGRDVLAYDCGSPGSHVAKPTVARVFEDYALRIARRSAETGDTAMLRELMVAYERKDWASLERLVVADACVAGALAVSPARFPDPASSPPDFELALVGGDGRLALGALRGRIVVVDFWATWCIPCIEQMPALVRLAEEHGDSITVVGVVHQDSERRAAGWLATHPPGRMLHVHDGDGRVGRAYGVWGIPQTFVIDRDGMLMASPHQPRRRIWLHELLELAGIGH